MGTLTLRPSRLGKIALMAAVSDEREEEQIKATVNTPDSAYRLAITFVSGLTGDIQGSFIRSLIGCALQNEIVEKRSTQVHAVVHAGLDALRGVVHQVGADASLKLKVAIVRDKQWVAVALYGDAAYYPLTNHERAALGVMHL